jgi:serine/threonine protein kinase
MPAAAAGKCPGRALPRLPDENRPGQRTGGVRRHYQHQSVGRPSRAGQCTGPSRPARSARTRASGRAIPQLEILELLGMGGMGMVYKARQPNLDRIVALKILLKESAPHPSFAERFSREAKAPAKLNHPGIVNVYDFGQTGEYYYFVMEYVDGMNLRALLTRGRACDPRTS